MNWLAERPLAFQEELIIPRTHSHYWQIRQIFISCGSLPRCEYCVLKLLATSLFLTDCGYI